MAEEGYSGYQHYFRQVPIDEDFRDRFDAVLVNDSNEFEKIIDGVSGKIVAFDTETTGLHFEKDKIVGVSLSLDENSGYYFPFRHLKGENLPVSLMGKFHDFLMRNYVLMFNSPFDLIMWRKEGFDITNLKTFDTMILCFNADTNEKRVNLKDMSKRFLGRIVPEFGDIVKGKTFDELDPVEGVEYASYDTANVMALHRYLYPKLKKECEMTLSIDANFIRALIHILTQEIHLDNEGMEEVVSDIKSLMKKVEKKMWGIAKRQFRISSPIEKTEVFKSLGLDTGVETKDGNMGFAADVLEKMDAPISKLLIEWSSLEKQRNSYAEKLSKYKTGRINYKPCRVPTARLASGQEKAKNDYFLPMNYQNFTKPKEITARAVQVGLDHPKNVMGWVFDPCSDEEKEKNPEGLYVEYQDPKLNVRKAVTVPDPDEWYFVGMDYVQQELVVIAVLSNNEVMLEAFHKGEDIYETIGKQMYGSSYDSSKRKNAKICVLGLNYGGSPWTIHKNSGLPMKECEDMYNTYWRTMWQLKNWSKIQVDQCRANDGVCYNMYGRPRRLRHWLFNVDSKKRYFGERSVVNYQVQGTCGDIIRIVLTRLYDNIFSNPKMRDRIKFVGTVHDEINLAVRKDSFEELIPEVKKNMSITLPRSDIKLEVDTEVGYSYGDIVKFEEKEGVWQPAFVK